MEIMGIETKTITDKAEKRRIARSVLVALPDWFGNTEARDNYICDCMDLPFYAAFDEDRPVGFICMKETGKDTAEIHVMGVLQDYHRKGIGKKLFEKAKSASIQFGYSFLQVKTVQMGRYEDYDKTNLFYRALGFKEFEVFPSLWDEANLCQVYVMSLE